MGMVYMSPLDVGMVYISGCFECQLGAKVLVGRASWRNWFQTTTKQAAMQIRVQSGSNNLCYKLNKNQQFSIANFLAKMWDHMT